MESSQTTSPLNVTHAPLSKANLIAFSDHRENAENQQCQAPTPPDTYQPTFRRTSSVSYLS